MYYAQMSLAAAWKPVYMTKDYFGSVYIYYNIYTLPKCKMLPLYCNSNSCLYVS